MRLVQRGIWISSIVVWPAFGQTPPFPEGSLPQAPEMARVVEAAGNIASTPGRRATVMTHGDSPLKPQVIAGAAVPGGGATTGIASRPRGSSGSNSRFTGPIRITAPGVGLASKIVEQDGRFIIVGGSDVVANGVLDQGIFAARFEADGTPDTSFGEGGSVRISLFAERKMVNNSSPSVALSPSGKIVIARTITDLFPGNIPGDRVVVIRLDQNGHPDATFGSGGLAFTTIKNHFTVNAVVVQRDEKVIVAGESGHRGDCRDEACIQMATLVRYRANGQPDASFGNGGIVRTTWGINWLNSRRASFNDLFVQENGLVVAAGEIETGSGEIVTTSKMLVAEYLPTGELNPAFASNGAAMLDFGGPYQKFRASSLAFRENGQILIAGVSAQHSGSAAASILVNEAFVFAQLRPGGDLDLKFGTGGKLLLDVNPLGGPAPERPLDELSKIMLTPSGEIYAAGMASGPVGNPERAIEFVALNSDGSLKQNFGTGGQYVVGTYSPWKLWLAQDALLTSQGRLVISGTHWPDQSSPDGFVLWAYSVNADTNR